MYNISKLKIWKNNNLDEYIRIIVLTKVNKHYQKKIVKIF